LSLIHIFTLIFVCFRQASAKRPSRRIYKSKAIIEDSDTEIAAVDAPLPNEDINFGENVCISFYFLRLSRTKGV